MYKYPPDTFVNLASRKIVICIDFSIQTACKRARTILQEICTSAFAIAHTFRRETFDYMFIKYTVLAHKFTL